MTRNAFTNSDGEARVTFTVSMCPGDNFRISAAPSESKRDEMDQTMADNGTPPDHVKLTQMLTVWRKLWIERDSMDTVASSGSEKNYVSGEADWYNYMGNPTWTYVDLGQPLMGEWGGEENHFATGSPGYYDVPGREPAMVMYNSGFFDSGTDDYAEVFGNLEGANKNYDLYDDDYEKTGSNDFVPHVELPVYLYLGPCINGFREAYIEPIHLQEYKDVVSFDRNICDLDVHWGWGDWNDSHDLPSNLSDFWSVLVVTGYQPGTTEDADPGTEEACLGQARVSADECIIFMEIVREDGGSEHETVAHEIAHTALGSGHCGNQGCILHEDAGEEFCEQCISQLRSLSDW